MSYKFSGQKVIINGVEQIIVPSPLPSTPAGGFFAIDSSDNKLKIYVPEKSRWVILGDADDVFFDNSDSDFTSSNAEDAIKEAGTLADAALNTPRYSIVLQHNSTVSNNTFLGYDSLIPGDSTPIVIPIKSILTEYAFSNQRSSADFTIELRKNSTSAAPFDSESRTNSKTYVKSGLNQSFNIGDTVFIKYIDQGTNASDVVILLLFKVVP